ncbi:MAG: tRNA (N6-isopentenyl adenosine(37)-C2)-methylthiotransferase MiaB [Prevotellaceae bacterium]|jgi:tRNA-2-methylthio-N6-dimethylallyladenosine synthase|nr:tRNA (N6-isopentenyl adenosine(37)-C2)-methylthiotransferase MiaB [Prevotellaceae bacterium]
MTNKFHTVRPVANALLPQFFVETYGCQMNVNDSEVVVSVMQEAGYSLCNTIDYAEIIFINTCSIRDNAEQRIWGRLEVFNHLKKKNRSLKVGVLGCMAKRLKEEILSHPAVDLVAGPDAYRKLPKLLESVNQGEKQIEVNFNDLETYSDISPVRTDPNGVSAFVSIMRGCNNMCAYCVVPFVRGRERSRDPKSIRFEVEELVKNGYKEVTLIGQNVDSYLWVDPNHNPDQNLNFAKLLEVVALIDPKLRIRFATSHPKDMGNGVLYTMAMYPNICNHIHLPVQSGSDRMLSKMNRNYTRERYLERVAAIRQILPECTISTDFIAGFCDESPQDHADTLSLMHTVKFDQAFMFQYSERPNTKAAEAYPDNVPEETKTQRLNEIIALQNQLSLESNQRDVGKTFEVLVEGPSKRSDLDLFGRTPQNKVCVFPRENAQIGDFVKVTVSSCSSATLIGSLAEKSSSRK